MYQEKIPHPSIAESIKCFWSITRTFTAERPVFEILPDSYVELLFCFGEPCYLHIDGDLVLLDNPSIIGLLEKPLLFQTMGRLQVIGVRVYPWAAHRLLSVVAHQRGISTDDQDYEQLVNGLRTLLHQGCTQQAFDLLEDHFTQKAKIKSHNDKLLLRGGAIILGSNGVLKMDRLADSLGMSARTLQRLFLESTGSTAKAIVRKLRFERIRDKIWTDPNISFTALAYEYGFADQAHFNHEFRYFSNKTPGQFAREASLNKIS